MLNFLLSCTSTASSSSSSGCYDWPVIKQIITFFGWIIEYLYKFLDQIGIASIGLCIIIFTLLVKFCLLPLTIKQQKFTKLTAIMQPEITAIQNKYKGRTDNYAMQAQQEETKAVYSKYGVSQMGGCLQSFIQLPVIIALYGALRKIPLLLENMRTPFETIIEIISQSEFADVVSDVGLSLTGTVDTDISTMYNLTTSTWNSLIDGISGVDSAAAQTVSDCYSTITSLNSFMGFDLSQSPWSLMLGGGLGIIAVILPIVAGCSQWLSMKISQTKESAASTDQMAQTNKTMTWMMPLVSVFFCFTLNAGLGLYWATSSLFQVVLQVIINRHYRKVDMDEFVKKNLEKAEKKDAKKKKKSGVTGEGIRAAANTNTKNVSSSSAASSGGKMSISEIANMDVRKAQTPSKPAPDSLAAKAAMVSELDKEKEAANGTTAKRKYKK